MPCFHPILAWHGPGGRPVFRKLEATYPGSYSVPCGQCIGCRLERSRQWALRCMCEAQMHDSNCVVTLTYADAPSMLVKRDFQTFMKRLRKRISPQKVRFLACGEYGDQFSRPHFHAGLFGWCPTDMIPFKGKFRSPFLESVWTAGFSLVDFCSFDAFAYIARYIVKKVTGENADGHYIDVETGEYLCPEFLLCSRRPGLARSWLERFGADCYPSGTMCDGRGGVSTPPRYFDRLVKDHFPSLYEESKSHRHFKDIDIWALDSMELNASSRLSLKGSRNFDKEL